MGTIFYSMSGEGRGHATRAWTIVLELMREHRVVLFAPGDAYELLEGRCRQAGLELRRIPGPRFCYDARARLNPWATSVEFCRYLWNGPRLVRRLMREIERERPDLIITDFEPALPRAARRCGVPFISVDHQHFLVVNDLSTLPLGLRCHAQYMSVIVQAYFQGEAGLIVSSFYAPPLRPEFKDVVQVGVLLREEVRAKEPRPGDHILVYVRKHLPTQLLEALLQSGREVRVYGAGERAPQQNLTFKPVSQDEFLNDLASSAALITTAGNQLVGEALYLRKPVLALPESGNYEQYINAHFLKEQGTGDWVEMEAVSPEVVRDFLQRVPEYAAKIDPKRVDGTRAAIQAIRCFIHKAAQRPPLAAAI